MGLLSPTEGALTAVPCPVPALGHIVTSCPECQHRP